MKYRRGIFIVVYSVVKNKIQYLILKRRLHWKGWEFPKGGKRIYETQKMTARREVKEETGLKILNMRRFNLSGRYRYDKKYPDRKNLAGQSYNAVFAVKVKKEKVKLDRREHSDYKWVGLSEAVKKLKWENQRKCLKIVDRFFDKN